MAEVPADFQILPGFSNLEAQPMLVPAWPHGHHGRLGEDNTTFVRTTESSAISPFEALKILEEGNKRHFEKYGV